MFVLSVFPLMDKLAISRPEDQLHESANLKLASETSLKVEEIVPRVDRALQFVINNFEHLYQRIYGERKEVLINFRAWMQTQLERSLLGDYKNVEIPGQLSFSQYSLKKKQVLLVSYEKRAYLSSSNAICGTRLPTGRVLVLFAVMKKRFLVVKNCRSVYSGGFSSEQIHLQQLSKKGLENAISGKQVTTIVVDGKIEQTEEILKRLYNHRFDEKSMVHVLCPDDSPHVEDFEQTLRSFAECRSFAVNTMRHGAPLELDL